MPGLRPQPAGNQFRLFLFDPLTDRSMAHSLLFREGFIDTVNFSLGHFFQPLMSEVGAYVPLAPECSPYA
jgi:hypothetical protein